MHTKPIICAIAALSVGFSGLAFAQQDKDVRADQAYRDGQRGTEQHRDQRRTVPEQPPQRAVERARGQDGRRDEFNREHEWQRNGERRSDSSWREGKGHHRFNRGDRLPTEYRSRQYVVDDWRAHRLSAPPRGYHWVEADGNFLLVAVTTGIIASILLNQ